MAEKKSEVKASLELKKKTLTDVLRNLKIINENDTGRLIIDYRNGGVSMWEKRQRYG